MVLHSCRIRTYAVVAAVCFSADAAGDGRRRADDQVLGVDGRGAVREADPVPELRATGGEQDGAATGTTTGERRRTVTQSQQ